MSTCTPLQTPAASFSLRNNEGQTPTRKHTQLNRKGQVLTHRVGRKKGGKEEGTEIEGEHKDKGGGKERGRGKNLFPRGIILLYSYFYYCDERPGPG